MIETIAAMDPVVILAFMAAGVALNLTPGADVMFAMASGMRSGWRAGFAAAIGITLGSAVHILLAAAGVSAAIAAVPYAFDAIRYLGAVYLLYLAFQAWWAASLSQSRGATDMRSAVRNGFVTNLLNPKVALFVLAFLPQFTDPTIGPVWQQFIALGAIFLTTGLIITGAYGAFAGLLSARIRKSSIILNRVSAVIFGGLAARLALN